MYMFMNGFLFAKLLSNKSVSGKCETYDERHKEDKTAPTSDNIYNLRGYKIALDIDTKQLSLSKKK